MHMYRTDLASISEMNHYVLSSAWQQFNDSSDRGMEWTYEAVISHFLNVTCKDFEKVP